MYKLGYTFYLENDYEDIVKFCNSNNYIIVEIGKDKKGFIYQIQETPKLSTDKLLNLLRAERELECFPIINRGKLWYDTLTEQELEDLNIWYNSWLDVTKTLIRPTKPSWLK